MQGPSTPRPLRSPAARMAMGSGCSHLLHRLLPAGCRGGLIAGFGLLLAVLPALPPPLQATTVCVLTPRLTLTAAGEAVASVPVGAPTILSSEGLEEVRIQADAALLWQQRALPRQPIEGPIPWPLAPIRPGQRLKLLLRPADGPEDDFAVIVLQGDSAERMERVRRQLEGLGNDPLAWWTAIQQAFSQDDMSLGLALLFDLTGPSSPRLDNLRRAVYQAGCGSGPDPGPGARPG